MGFNRGVGSTKGDMWSPIEILVERSSTNNRVTVTMWKRHDDKFQVAKKQVGQQKYEDCCDKPENGCSPYPEAKDYYGRIYKSKGLQGLLQALT